MITPNVNTNKKGLTIAILIGLILSGFLIFFIYAEFFNHSTPFDIVDKENDKIIAMFDKQIEYQIDSHTKSNMHSGYIESSRQNTIDYLTTISSIESYARYGISSTQSRNYLELKITFIDGSIADKVYTGVTCSGYFEPHLLLKVQMKNGKTVKVLTNGSEKRGSPNDIVNDLNTLIDKAISYDIGRNHDDYFKPQKTQEDFQKEWEEKK
jgi:hypothetical protein